jgi:hypothetical protein
MSALDSVSIPKSTGEAMTNANWRQAMVEEMAALHSNNTWDIVPLPPNKTTVVCRWVYTVKVGPDGQIDRMLALTFSLWTEIVPTCVVWLLQLCLNTIWYD